MAPTKRTPALDGRRSGALVADAIDHRVLNALTESEQDDSSSNSEHLLGSIASASQLPTGAVGVSGASFLGPHLRPCLGSLWIIGRPEVQRLLGTAEIATA
jgi:hypothetical protein